MSQGLTPLNAEQEELLAQLTQSHARVLALAQDGKPDAAALSQVANALVSLARYLHPLPLDPGEQVLAAHAYARPYLERLPQHDPTHIVIADEAHSYTPRKILRRVLDHALDHLNQIDQWLVWQQQGIVPTPTDGWATSGETFQEDQQPVSQAELRAWLWRIDLAIEMVAQRATCLQAEQLDWIPPTGGWTLRQMLHHLAAAEVYYVTWLDEPLPDEPIARYCEAYRRFEQQLRQVFALPTKEKQCLFSPDHRPTTAEHLAHMALDAEHTLLHS